MVVKRNILGKDTPKEDWATIEGYEKYEISTRGKVRDINTKKFIKQYTYKETGYYYVSLYKNYLPKKHLVHVLMAKAFMGYKESENKNKYIVSHKDLHPRNNLIENLEIISNADYLDKCLKHCKGDLLLDGIHPVSTGFNRFLYRVEVTINNLVVYLGTCKTQQEAVNLRTLGLQYKHLFISPTQYRRVIYKLFKGTK